MLTTLLSTKNLDFRYERKFCIETLDAATVRSLVVHHPSLFNEAYSSRRVNNLYFDTVVLSSFSDNVEGNVQRVKARIRWYGGFFGHIKKPVLELKIKRGAMGTKLHYNLKPFSLSKGFSFDVLTKTVFPKSNLPAWILEKLKHLQPTLFNTYERSYYQSQNKHFRLTLDTNITYYKASKLSNSFLSCKHPQERIVLELKYKPEYDKDAHFITQHFPLRLDKHSKYVSGIMNLH